MEIGSDNQKIFDIDILNLVQRTQWWYYDEKLIHQMKDLTEEEVIILKLSLRSDTIFILLPDLYKQYPMPPWIRSLDEAV